MELLFLDTETGGLEPEHNSLLQVGMVAVKDGMMFDTSSFTIKEENYRISAEALHYNKLDLYNDIYKNGVSRVEALGLIIAFCKTRFTAPPILVGHNPAMDKFFIRKLFTDRDADMDKFISHRMIDTMSIIWALHAVGKLPTEACSSTGAFEYFGIEVSKRHDALYDCLATVKLYFKLLELIKG